MIVGAHHISMTTPDMDRIVAFYRDGLGLDVIQEQIAASGPEMDAVVGLKGVEAKVAMLGLRNLVMEFIEYTAPPYDAGESVRQSNRPGWTHLAFDVTDIDEVYRSALAAGATFHAPPCNFGDTRATYGRDPDSNIFELQELMIPDHRWRLAVLDGDGA